jgi:hypothetical protein
MTYIEIRYMDCSFAYVAFTFSVRRANIFVPHADFDGLWNSSTPLAGLILLTKPVQHCKLLIKTFAYPPQPVYVPLYTTSNQQCQALEGVAVGQFESLIY